MRNNLVSLWEIYSTDVSGTVVLILHIFEFRRKHSDVKM